MWGLFANLKQLYHTYCYSDSATLLNILLPSYGSGSVDAALEFIQNHTDQPIDIYYEKAYYDITASILHMAIILNSLPLVKGLLANSLSHSRTTHNWRIVQTCLNSARHNSAIYQELINYYLPRLPSLSKKPISSFVIDEVDINNYFEHHFSHFPAQELWRLFIDGVKQKNEPGWLEYELREPGCMQAMLNGFQYLKESMCEPLTIDIINEMHRRCTLNVSHMSRSITPGDMRHHAPVEFSLSYDLNISIRGFMQVVESVASMATTHKLDAGYLVCMAVDADVIINQVQNQLDKYHNALQKNESHANIVDAIIKLITELERIHPFSDGNCRTLCIFILNRELIRAGLSPVILTDPNRFDGYSRDELFNEVAEGMLRFQRVKSGVIEELGITTEEISRKILLEDKYRHLQNLNIQLSTHLENHIPQPKMAYR